MFIFNSFLLSQLFITKKRVAARKSLLPHITEVISVY
nr:MAG TPA: hypothetical protein [Caudoviricetes sp.]